MLDMATEREHLAQAERHVAEGEARIARQAELVERLRGGGQDVAAAEALLTNLQQTLAIWKDHRAEILATIARLEQCPSADDERR
jgi:hypothetical protein